MNGNRRRRLRWAGVAAAVLLAIGLVSSVACTSSKSQTPADNLAGLRSAITNEVADAGRADDMLAVVDQMEAAMVDLGKTVDRHQVTIAELYRDYDATRSEVWEALESYQNERREVVDRLVEIHYELKDLARDDEWPKLAKAERRAVEAMAMTTLGSAPLPLLEG